MKIPMMVLLLAAVAIVLAWILINKKEAFYGEGDPREDLNQNDMMVVVTMNGLKNRDVIPRLSSSIGNGQFRIAVRGVKQARHLMRKQYPTVRQWVGAEIARGKNNVYGLTIDQLGAITEYVAATYYLKYVKKAPYKQIYEKTLVEMLQYLNFHHKIRATIGG